MRDEAPPCLYLEWDSAFFGYRIARVTAGRLTQTEMEGVIEWAQAQAIDCLYFLADADDQTTVQVAEAHRFTLVDIRLTLEKRVPLVPIAREEMSPPGIRLATPEDLPALRALARISHQDSRFYHDSHFSDAQCDALYELWIEKSCNGSAQAVWVVAPEGQPMGYLSCHLSPQREGSIGLVAIGPAAQGHGWGQRLLQAALHWFAAQEATEVSVVTQGRNVRAQRLYQRGGFLTRSLQLWYHWWSPTVQANSESEAR